MKACHHVYYFVMEQFVRHGDAGLKCRECDCGAPLVASCPDCGTPEMTFPEVIDEIRNAGSQSAEVAPS